MAKVHWDAIHKVCDDPLNNQFAAHVLAKPLVVPWLHCYNWLKVAILGLNKACLLETSR